MKKQTKRTVKRVLYMHPVRDIIKKDWKVPVQYSTGAHGFEHFESRVEANDFVNQHNN